MEIRKATLDDLEQIRVWLQQEKNDGYDSFIVNFSMLVDGQQNGSLTVLADEIPIAFALGQDNLDILAVKLDRRGDRVGRTLAEHWFERARDRDLMGFHGECAPRASLGFWQKIGCKQVESPHMNGNAPWVAMPFRRKHELPAGVAARRVSFEVSSPTGHPSSLWNFSTDAAEVAPHDLILAEDFVAYVPNGDTRVVIIVDGSEVGDVKARDIDHFGGSRKLPWVRVRDLALPSPACGSATS